MPPPNSYADLSNSLADLLREGRTGEAIIAFQHASDSSYQESRDFIEDLLAGVKPDIRALIRPKDPILPLYVQKVKVLAEETIGKSSVAEKVPENILQVMDAYSADFIRSTLGDLGKSFVKFRGIVHKEHPSLCGINSGTLGEGGKVYDRVSETLAIVKFARSQGFKEMPAVVCDWINRNHTRIQKVMLKPPARLLRSASARRTTRLIAKPKNIELSAVFDKGRKNTWDLLPTSFVPYVRMGPGFTEEAEKLKRLSERVKVLGMVSQANALQYDIDDLHERIADQYYGFVRIKLVDAALLAAKVAGGQWATDRGVRIAIPTATFQNPFWITDRNRKLSDDPYLSDIFDRHITIEAHYPQRGPHSLLTYTPIAYPFLRFAATQPDGVAKIMETLDCHPDMNNSPVFDNMWVIVPGVTVNAPHSDHYEFHDGEECHKYYDYWEYRHALDVYLTKSQQIFPIIVGEQISSKKCYFVSYWG